MVKALSRPATLLASLLLATLLSSCGGKDTHEKINDELVVKLQELVTTIGTVKDKSTAETAATKLDGMVAEFESLAARQKALGKPDPETEKALQESYGETLEDLMLKVSETMMSASDGNPEILKILEVQMEKIGKAILSSQ